MQSLPISEKIEANRESTFTLRDEIRATLEVVSSISVAFFVLVLFALMLRGVEVFVETKIRIPEAHAATLTDTREAYGADLMLRDAKKIQMTAGEKRVYRLGFKNIGDATWLNSGHRFVSIYTYGPKYRKSVFEDLSWRLPEQPAVMKDPTAPPGALGFIEFILHAPEQAGTYTETFRLAAEDLVWIPGGLFSIEISVQESKAVVPEPKIVVPEPEIVNQTEGYQATLLLRSHKKEIETGPGEAVNMILGYKNSGTKTWNNRILKPAGITLATLTAADFKHLSWASANEVVRSTDRVRPGELGFVNFTLQAPHRRGSYAPKFHLVVDEVPVPGSEIMIPITVTADGIPSAVSAPLPQVEIIPEPEMRVGILPTRKPVMISASNTYTITDSNDRTLVTVAGGQPTKTIFDFDYRTFTIATPTGTQIGRGHLRFNPSTPDTIFTVVSYNNPPGWNKTLNDNRFRGTIELKQAPQTGRLWVIEELPMSQYLYGIAETSNNSETEFQKALATAARTYAFYHFTRNTKHGGVFHVDSKYDQVYRGYGSEIRMPRWEQSVDASRGVIVTYNNEIAITPYYSRSDGRTRDWTEVWGGRAKPWLVSVPAPYDEGKTLWGHGVGMAARDALLRARDGADWQTILKHYYTGIELQKRWN